MAPTEGIAGCTDSKAKEKEQMSILKTATTTAFCLALMGAVFSPGAKADSWNRKTVVTFSGPVEIPGVHLKGWAVLPAGTYVFKILDSLGDRHIVQIFNKAETQVYATILAIPNYRLQSTDKTVITFRERPAGQPEALRAWFYPGRNWGEEFVYPKAKAIELAKETHTAVLYTPVDLTLEVTNPVLTATEPEVMQLKQAPVMAIQPTGDEVEIAAVVTPPPAAELDPDTAPTQVAAVLPQTASWLPFIALLGLLALGGAWTLRLVQKRIL
ncbi:MAG: hypothetical protein ABSC23_19010 [Bryobacteraceae bacterium]|jgi:hypothetical protein